MATILIVDDHVVHSHFLTTLLGYGGHRLLEARDGDAGLASARTEPPDLVIVDILMPAINGPAFVARIRSDPHLAAMPIIFYSATCREPDATAIAEACGVRWVLSKTSGPDQILRIVHEALGLPLSTEDFAPATLPQSTAGPLATIDHQLVGYLTDLENSSRLIAQIAHNETGHDISGEQLAQIVQRLTGSLSSLQEVSLRLTALVELGIDLATQRDPATLLETGANLIQHICTAAHAAVAVIDQRDRSVRHLAVRGMDPTVKTRLKQDAAHMTAMQEQGVLARLLDDGQPVRLAGMSGDPGEIGLAQWHPPVHSFLAVAIASRERMVGWLYLVDKLAGPAFSEVDERAAATVAAQLAVAYENLVLYEQIQANHTLLTAEIASRVEAQEMLATTLRVRRVVARCNQAIVRASDEVGMLDQMCKTVVELGCYSMAWIGYVGAAGQLLAIAQSGMQENESSRLATDWADASPAATVIATGAPVMMGDLASDLSPSPWRERAIDCGHGSVISLPLKEEGRVFGVFTICAALPDTFDAGQIEMLEELADDVSYGLINLRNRHARESAEKILHDTEDKLVKIMSTIDNVVWSHSGSRLLYLNPIAEKIYGRPVEQFFADPRLWFKVIHPDDALRVHNRRSKLLELGSLTQEYRIILPDGTIRWVENRARAIRDDDGVLLRFDGVETDITSRKEYEARFVHMANHDTLTGLANRNLLSDRLAQAMLHARRSAGLLALLFIDLDRFKEVNDSGGHTLGDALLKAVALRLCATIREEDTVARQGGDEFIILLANLRLHSDAIGIVNKISNAFAQPFIVNGHTLFMSASIGVTMYPSDSDDISTLLRNADTAMYRAKEDVGNSVQFYSSEMSVRSIERTALEASLRQACKQQQFAVYYQPKVDITTEQIIGSEALIRWRLPDGSMISPAVFIPVAEEIGLIVEIGNWVLRTACAQNKAWQDDGLPCVSVAVNLSARQFMQPGLIESVSNALRDSGLDARYLELELTESIMMNSAEHFITTLHALKALGVQLSIDDFGTGYSSLSYLKRFPIDRLKIDQSFIRDIVTDPGDATITRAVIALGHSLNLKVIAEGVETPEQLAFLLENHCDEIQGYYFSRPVAAGEFGVLLECGVRRGVCLVV